jgi:hypothetical protein
MHSRSKEQKEQGEEWGCASINHRKTEQARDSESTLRWKMLQLDSLFVKDGSSTIRDKRRRRGERLAKERTGGIDGSEPMKSRVGVALCDTRAYGPPNLLCLSVVSFCLL